MTEWKRKEQPAWTASSWAALRAAWRRGRFDICTGSEQQVVAFSLCLFSVSSVAEMEGKILLDFDSRQFHLDGRFHLDGIV